MFVIFFLQQTGEAYNPSVTFSNSSSHTSSNHSLQNFRTNMRKLGNRYYGVIAISYTRRGFPSAVDFQTIFLPTSITPTIISAFTTNDVGSWNIRTVSTTGNDRISSVNGGFRLYHTSGSNRSKTLVVSFYA